MARILGLGRIMPIFEPGWQRKPNRYIAGVAYKSPDTPPPPSSSPSPPFLQGTFVYICGLYTAVNTHGQKKRNYFLCVCESLLILIFQGRLATGIPLVIFFPSFSSDFYSNCVIISSSNHYLFSWICCAFPDWAGKPLETEDQKQTLPELFINRNVPSMTELELLK